MGPALLSSQQAGAAGPALCQGSPPCPSLHTQGLRRCAWTGVLRPQQDSPLWLSLESSHQLHPCHHLYTGPLVLSPPLAAFTSGKPEGGVESLPVLGANQSMRRKGRDDLWGPGPPPELGKPRCRRGRPEWLLEPWSLPHLSGMTLSCCLCRRASRVTMFYAKQLGISFGKGRYTFGCF